MILYFFIRIKKKIKKQLKRDRKYIAKQKIGIYVISIPFWADLFG